MVEQLLSVRNDDRNEAPDVPNANCFVYATLMALDENKMLTLKQ